MADQFSQVRHYLAIAEEAIAEREERDKETIAEQAKYITQLERDGAELEKMNNALAGQLALHGIVPNCKSHTTCPRGLEDLWLAWAEREARK
jgi:hypothetical protein